MKNATVATLMLTAVLASGYALHVPLDRVVAPDTPRASEAGAVNSAPLAQPTAALQHAPGTTASEALHAAHRPPKLTSPHSAQELPLTNLLLPVDDNSPALALPEHAATLPSVADMASADGYDRWLKRQNDERQREVAAQGRVALAQMRADIELARAAGLDADKLRRAQEKAEQFEIGMARYNAQYAGNVSADTPLPLPADPTPDAVLPLDLPPGEAPPDRSVAPEH